MHPELYFLIFDQTVNINSWPVKISCSRVPNLVEPPGTSGIFRMGTGCHTKWMLGGGGYHKMATWRAGQQNGHPRGIASHKHGEIPQNVEKFQPTCFSMAVPYGHKNDVFWALQKYLLLQGIKESQDQVFGLENWYHVVPVSKERPNPDTSENQCLWPRWASRGMVVRHLRWVLHFAKLEMDHIFFLFQ